MFHDIPASAGDQMQRLQALDAEQRSKGIPTPERLCAVPPETGRFLALLAASAPPGALVEIGTSGGYSTLWLTRAGYLRGQRVNTVEQARHKLAIARETFAASGVSDLVDLAEGDASEFLAAIHDIAFCFMDHAKEQYTDCYELVVPKLVAGGLLAADNVVSHSNVLAPFVAHVMNDRRVDAVVVPIGKGVLVARRI